MVPGSPAPIPNINGGDARSGSNAYGGTQGAGGLAHFGAMPVFGGSSSTLIIVAIVFIIGLLLWKK